ncbi:DUF5018 domain-containing protein [Ichthyobacterium seriolicida]|uniref:Pkd domain containing protein n=1 Tax=Ichthyobacterium seriolicida TaxID=242600 RepID=A0A1J1E252_9FLAO|nr:hypothetical protein [Ichthyobacterium seriolicida]BAV94116.1 hypothetical protein JBKA6_0103 [Ichthyobacterium seriolicida]
MFKKNYFVKSIIFSFVLLSIIFFSCDKKKIIEDNMNICIESFSLLDSENEGKNLGSDINCDIDINNHTISLTVPSSAELTGLKFNITSCEGTTISPASGEETDFELVENPSEESTEEPSEQSTETPSPKRYKKVFTLTSPDNTTQDYTVYMTRESTPVLSSFLINADKGKGIKAEVAAVITDDTETATGRILLKIPYNESIDLTGLSFTATIPDNHTLDPAAGTISEDINGKEFTLKTALGSQRVYTVEVVKGPYIESFKFAAAESGGSSTNTGITGEGVTGIIDHIAGTISVTVPNGVTLSNLTPTIEVGENTKPDFTPSAQTDFSQSTATPVKYTVTSSNSSATDFTKVYTVSVTQNTEPQIGSFTFTQSGNSGKNIVNDISGDVKDDGTIIVKVPHDATLTELVPTVTASTAPSGTQIYKGESGTTSYTEATDFSSSHTTAVKYSAVGPAGGRKVYSVKVYKEPRITEFKFTKTQNAGNSGFPTSPTEYSASPINHGNFLGSGTIAIRVANTVDITNLKASITGDNIAADYVTPTALDFSSNNTQTVNVPNQYLPGYTKTYTVTLTKEAAPKLTGFTIQANETNGIAGEVIAEFTHPSGTSNTGTIKLKFDHKVTSRSTDIDLTNLNYTSEPTQGYTLTPASGTSGDINGKQFTLIKTDTGSKSIYTVQAVKGPFIKSFKFGKDTSGNNGKNLGDTDVTGAIDHANSTITVTLPATVKKDSEGTENKIILTPTIELGGDGSPTVNPAKDNPQQFTSGTAVDYTVTANGMTKTYAVTVTRTKSNLAQITSFAINSDQGDITETVTGSTDDKGRIVVPVTSPPASSTPTIKQSDYATITSPSGEQTFSYENPVTYTVRAENGSTSKKYDVFIHDSTKVVTAGNITVTSPSTGANVTSVDETTRVITITVSSGTTGLDTLTLTFNITSPSSLTLTADPTGAKDFSNGAEVKYTLKENTDIKGHYWVKVVKSN